MPTMTTTQLIAVWAVLISVAALAARSPGDYAAAVCAVLAMVPLSTAHLRRSARRQPAAIPVRREPRRHRDSF